MVVVPKRKREEDYRKARFEHTELNTQKNELKKIVFFFYILQVKVKERNDAQTHTLGVSNVMIVVMVVC